MRILVVEDDFSVGLLLELALRDEGFEVDRARDGPEALTKARAGQPDLVLLDYMLPTKSGVDVATELRATERPMPIIMLTARDAPEDRKAGLAAGVTEFMAKPFRIDDLLDRIHALVPGRVDG